MVRWIDLTLPTRAYLLVDAPPDPRAIVLAFHGYAERPAHALEGLRKAGIKGAVLAGLMGQHHFYDREGKVVASWMTKFNREHQVEQILDYARGVSARLFSDFGKLPLYCFGFSQGAASAYRVSALGGLPIRRLFVLAGDMPPECRSHLESSGRALPGVPVTILWGAQDTRVPRAALEADRERLEAAGWPVELLTVEGAHDYAPAAMEQLGRRVEQDLAS